MSAKLEIEVLGDVGSLERALARAKADLAKFKAQAEANAGAVVKANANAGSSFAVLGGKADKGLKAFRSPAGAFAGGVLATTGLAALKDIIATAQESEIILGQTRVAVEAVGLSWEQNAKRIDKAGQAIARAASLDDEAVFQSFQTFVRTQKDVEKAMSLTSLAADVARGRYISLESATQIVNKASLGQIGSLRRIGIQLDKNATATEALAALQQNYAGAARTYSTRSAGAVDRLNKSLGDAKELIGGALLPVVEDLAGKLELAVGAGEKLATALGSIGSVSLGPLGQVKDVLTDIAKFTGPQGIFFGGKAAFDALFGGGGVSDAARGQAAAANAFGSTVTLGQQFGGASAGGPSSIFSRVKPPLTNLPVGFQNATLRAQNDNDVGALLKQLFVNRKFLETQLQRAVDAGDTEAINKIRSAIEGTQAAITGIYEDRAQEAQRVKDEMLRRKEEQRRKAEDRAQKLEDAITGVGDVFSDAIGSAVEAVQGVTERLNQFKQQALDRLDRQQAGADTSRALRDARDAVARARQAGGRIGLRNALEQLGDAQRSRARFLLENSTITPAGGGVNIRGSVNIHIDGAKNPEAVADAVVKVLQRRGKQRAPQFSGRAPGGIYGIPH